MEIMSIVVKSLGRSLGKKLSFILRKISMALNAEVERALVALPDFKSGALG